MLAALTSWEKLPIWLRRTIVLAPCTSILVAVAIFVHPVTAIMLGIQMIVGYAIVKDTVDAKLFREKVKVRYDVG